MQTFLDMQNELTARMMAANNSSLYSPTRIKQLLNDAYLKATEMYIWLELVKGQKSTSVIGQEYYDFPPTMRSGTIMRLELDGNKYDRKNFEDYLDYKKNDFNSTTRYFAIYARQFFITPTPTTANANALVVWGAVQATKLINDTDLTIFSQMNDAGNEAIVKIAEGVALERFDVVSRYQMAFSMRVEKEGMDMLQKLNTDQWAAYQRDQRLQHPQFDVPDFYPDMGRSIVIGQFAVELDPTST